MSTIVKTPAGTWKAMVRKLGWPTVIRTFRIKRDAEDWARQIEDEMVRGTFIRRAPSQKLTLAVALERYLQEVTPPKRKADRSAETIPAPRRWNGLLGLIPSAP